MMKSVQLASTLPLDLSLWHKRLGHYYYSDICKMISDELVDGLGLDSKAEPDPICELCLAGKMHANLFLSSEHHGTEVLELIYSDMHQIRVTSHSSYKYWVSFIDNCSCFKVLYPMKKKSDTFSCFQRFKACTENLTGKKIKGLCDDKGIKLVKVTRLGFEPRTFWIYPRYSHQLSYLAVSVLVIFSLIPCTLGVPTPCMTYVNDVTA